MIWDHLPWRDCYGANKWKLHDQWKKGRQKATCQMCGKVIWLAADPEYGTMTVTYRGESHGEDL